MQARLPKMVLASTSGFGMLTPPKLSLRVMLPMIVLAPTSTAALRLRLTLLPRVLPTQDAEDAEPWSPSSPIRTAPEFAMRTPRQIVLLHTVMSLARVAVRLPYTVELRRTSELPGGTVTLP